MKLLHFHILNANNWYRAPDQFRKYQLVLFARTHNNNVTKEHALIIVLLTFARFFSSPWLLVLISRLNSCLAILPTPVRIVLRTLSTILTQEHIRRRAGACVSLSGHGRMNTLVSNKEDQWACAQPSKNEMTMRMPFLYVAQNSQGAPSHSPLCELPPQRHIDGGKPSA